MDEDEDLVTLLRDGQMQAARRLYERHLPRVWRLALRIVQRRDLAEDCVQDAFVRAFERIEELREARAFGAWLLNIAYRIAVDIVRREARDREILLKLSVDNRSSEEADVWLRARLLHCLDELDSIYRDVFLMYELLGLTHGEVAAFLNIPEGSSKRRLFEARNRLRVMLKPMINEI